MAYRAHVAFFLDLAEGAEVPLWGADQAEWLDRLEEEHGNFRAALAWSIEQNPAVGLRLAGALWPFWRMRFHAGEGRDWLERALAAGPPGVTPARARALLGAGTLAWALGDYADAGSRLAKAQMLMRELNDEVGEGRVLLALGRLAWDEGETGRARKRFEAALALFEQAGNSHGTAMCLHGLALVAYKADDYDRAAKLFEQALGVWDALSYAWVSPVAFQDTSPMWRVARAITTGRPRSTGRASLSIGNREIVRISPGISLGWRQWPWRGII